MDSNQDQKQLDKRARILARAERAKAKLDGNESELSLPIRIQQSTLYDWKPAFRAVLFTISFMRVQGDSPFARPKPRQNWKGSYEGWCWASQETLAMRAGCSERWVQEAVRRFKADGIIEERYWRDRWGRPHAEYRIIEEKVDESQRDHEEPRPKCEYKVRKPNAGSFSSTHQPRRKPVDPDLNDSSHVEEAEPTRSLGREPHEASPASHTKGSPSPTRTIARNPPELTAVKGVGVGVAVEGEFEGSTSKTRASHGAADDSLRSTSNPKTVGGDPPHPPSPEPVTLAASADILKHKAERADPEPKRVKTHPALCRRCLRSTDENGFCHKCLKHPALCKCPPRTTCKSCGWDSDSCTCCEICRLATELAPGAWADTCRCQSKALAVAPRVPSAAP